MPEIDNCPVCGTTCELEFGLKEAVGTEYGVEISYATCKTCKTRWRRRDDPKVAGKLIYEKWACRIPELNISFPLIGGGIKLGPRWCRWVKVTERRIPTNVSAEVEFEEATTRQEKRFDERISIQAEEYAYYEFELSKGNKVRGKISSDEPVDVWFLDEKNFDKLDRDKSFQEEDGTEGVYETKLVFEATKKGSWFVVIQNQTETATEVEVHLHSP